MVPYVDKKPVIDGRIEESEWKNALKIDKFYQYSPGDMVKPSASTTFYMMYDGKNIYVVFYCSLKGVDKFLKIHERRDHIGRSEMCIVKFDTFCKHDKVYAIAFNPYGELTDGIESVVTGLDLSPDYDIYSKGKIYGDHYEIEARIPFRNFKFRKKMPMKWGVIISRSINMKRGNEWDCSMILDRDTDNNYKFEDYIIFNHPVRSKSMYLVPEFVGSYNREKFSSSYSDGYENSNYLGNIGCTVFFKPDSETRLGITVNPDFSEVEADDIKFDVNHRFPIFYEEKRPFFLESRENFSNPYFTLFHSRNIIDPDLGLKFIKEWGDQSLATLYAIERDKPGDRFGFYGLCDNINWLIMRYKYKLQKDSYLGFYSINRKFGDSNNNVLSLDGRYRVSERGYIGFMGIYSRYTNSPIFDGVTQRGGGWDLVYSYSSKHVNFNFESYGLSDGFYDDAGFIRRNDYWNYSEDLELHSQTEGNKKAVVEEYSLSFFNLTGYDFRGQLTDKNKSVNFFISLRGGHLFTGQLNRYYELFLGTGYNYANYGFGYICSHFKRFGFNFYSSSGDGVYYDYYFPQEGNSEFFSLNFEIFPMSSLTASLSTVYSKINSDMGDVKLYGYFSLQYKLKYQFNSKNYIRLLYEYRHYNYPLYSYSDNNHFVQLIYTYDPRSYTAFYTGFLYGRDHSLYHPYDWDHKNNYRIFFKIDYLINANF